MPALQLPAPVLYISSEPSFFGIIEGDSKHPTLKDVTRIDFPLIEKGEFQKENLIHALKSLEQKTLYVVVSDEVFYHHISDYATSAQKNIESEIKETVSEVFSDKKDPLHIVTVDLAKTSKMQTVQITAMTKSNSAILAEAADEVGLKILSILPASFVVKAFVSVDPSLFVLVTSNSFLLTSHYIGVDFAQNIAKDNIKELISTIKTLKKERPHIQHVYLCGDPEVITPLHEELADVLPVQDVEVKTIETEHDTPFFLRAFIVGVKEVIDNDFPLPYFSSEVDLSAPKAVQEEVKASHDDPIKTLALEMEKDKEVSVEKIEDEPPKELEETVEEDEPDQVVTSVIQEKTKTIDLEKEDEDKSDQKSLPESVVPKINIGPVEEPVLLSPLPAPIVIAPPEPPAIKSVESITHTKSEVITPKVIPSPKVELPSETDSESVKVAPTITVKSAPEVKTETVVERSTVSTTTVRTKKKSGIFKYVCLALGVALVISLIGGGVVTSQQALLDKKTPSLQTPLSEVTATPEEEPSPTPKPTEAPVELSELDMAVFNATSVAGKAGKTASAVKKEGAKTVDAGNAKADYEEKGNFIMFAKPEFSGAKATLEKATGLTLEEKEMNDKENPASKYDIIIILNE